MNIKINFVSKKIELTQKFYKAAQTRGSYEYHEIVSLMKELPDFRIEVKQPQRNCNRNTYKGLTFEAMESYIRLNDSDSLEVFNNLKMVYSNREGKYFKIREWFLRNYEEEFCYL